MKEHSKHRYLSDFQYFNHVRHDRGTTKAVRYILNKDSELEDLAKRVEALEAKLK